MDNAFTYKKIHTTYGEAIIIKASKDTQSLPAIVERRLKKKSSFDFPTSV